MMVAGRAIPLWVAMFTMTTTWLGGGICPPMPLRNLHKETKTSVYLKEAEHGFLFFKVTVSQKTAICSEYYCYTIERMGIRCNFSSVFSRRVQILQANGV